MCVYFSIHSMWHCAVVLGMPEWSEELLSTQALHLWHSGNRHWSCSGTEYDLSPQSVTAYNACMSFRAMAWTQYRIWVMLLTFIHLSTLFFFTFHPLFFHHHHWGQSTEGSCLSRTAVFFLLLDLCSFMSVSLSVCLMSSVTVFVYVEKHV